MNKILFVKTSMPWFGVGPTVQGQCLEWEIDPEKASLLVLEGGPDIATAWYGEKPSDKTLAECQPNQSEVDEVQKIQWAIERGVPILGICRGAQLLCALDGGKLYQHVTGHENTTHLIRYKGNEIMANSDHHQMMIPSSKAVVLATTTCRSPTKWTSFGQVYDSQPEPEIVYFPDLKAIGIQGHPEWMDRDSEYGKLTYQLIEEYLWT